jgi:hypothetical protein
MESTRFFVSSIGLGIILLSLLVLGVPSEGFTQTPHTCLNNQHHPQSIGGKTHYTFWYAKNCPPYTSGAIAWKYFVYRYSDNVYLCGEGPNSIGTTPRSYNCPAALPTGAYPKVKVVIHYQTSPGGSWMTHTELFGN